jgi:uncharacterized YigZ family protein
MMPMSEQAEVFQTVARAVRVKVPVGLCRFFASVKEVQTEEEARQFIAEVSAEMPDATHHAWAFRIGSREQAIARSSDAGEPANTAGPPMLQAIEGAGLTNVVVVGTRYFGGVKLGVGGLIRAYRDCAQAGLQAAGVRTEVLMQEVRVYQVDYAVLGDVLREIESQKGSILGIEYGQTVTIHAAIRPALREALQGRIADITRGQGQLEVVA